MEEKTKQDILNSHRKSLERLQCSEFQEEEEEEGERQRETERDLRLPPAWKACGTSVASQFLQSGYCPGQAYHRGPHW
jgi:hypothetical protein